MPASPHRSAAAVIIKNAEEPRVSATRLPRQYQIAAAGGNGYELARTQLAWGQALLNQNIEHAMELLREAQVTLKRLGARRDQQAVERLLKIE